MAQWIYTIAMIVFGVGDVYCLILWAQAQKQRAILQASEASLKIHQANAEAWKSNYDAEAAKYSNYRSAIHEKSQAANDQILKLTEENAVLKNKTDLTPIMIFHKEQNEVNQKVVSALDAILVQLVPKPERKLTAKGRK